MEGRNRLPQGMTLLGLAVLVIDCSQSASLDCSLRKVIKG